MTYDLLIRGGRVVDGSGLPSYLGDVGIKGGRVVEIGMLRDSAERVIDATGLVVAPGLIDHHTHLDAQILWDPYGTSEPEHGVTSVVMGNCGLTLAPVKEADRDELVKSFVRVEAMPRRALEEGISWGWHSYGDYLDGLEGRIGINVGGLVGHIAIRQHVMGDESTERPANDREISHMQQLVRDSLGEGALGFSTNRNPRHMREDGKPVASRLAAEPELMAMGEVLRELNAGTFLFSSGPEVSVFDRIARHIRRPVVWQSVQHRWNAPNAWREQLDEIAVTFRDGYLAFGLSNAVPIMQRFNLKNTQAFDEFPTWKNLMFLPEAARKAAFSDGETRAKLRAEVDQPDVTIFHKRWDLVYITQVSQAHQEYAGKSVAELGAMRGQHPVDALLDLSIDEDLETEFETAIVGGDPEVMGEILRSPYVLIGISDAGAHVEFDAAFGYGTTVLGKWVRERGVLSLEQAINKMTYQVAAVYGLDNRGLLRPGYAADLFLFDPTTVNACSPRWATDYPANTARLVQPSQGVHWTIVNGRVIWADGKLTGDLPGQVLRGAAYASAASSMAK